MAKNIPAKQLVRAGKKSDLQEKLIDRELGYCTDDGITYIRIGASLYPLVPNALKDPTTISLLMGYAKDAETYTYDWKSLEYLEPIPNNPLRLWSRLSGMGIFAEVAHMDEKGRDISQMFDAIGIGIVVYGDSTYDYVLEQSAVYKQLWVSITIEDSVVYLPCVKQYDGGFIFSYVMEGAIYFQVSITTDGWSDVSKSSLWPTIDDALDNSSTNPVENQVIARALLSKINRVTGAASGNLPCFDNNGNLVDSLKKPGDFATAMQGDKADSAIQDVAVNGSPLPKDEHNAVDVPVPVPYTSDPAMNGVASAGSASQWSKGDHVHPTDTSREAVANKTGTVRQASEADSTHYPSEAAVRSAIDSAVASAYHAAGTKTVEQLTSSLLVASNEGDVYNITNDGTTTSDFIDGAGKPIKAGDNVGVCSVGNGVYMFDLLSGFVDLSDCVRKSNTQGLLKNDGTVDTSDYLPKTGDGKDVTATFTKASGDTSSMASGGKLSSLFAAISSFFASLGTLAFKSSVAKADLSSDVQASLGKADSAVQSQDMADYVKGSEYTIIPTSGSKFFALVKCPKSEVPSRVCLKIVLVPTDDAQSSPGTPQSAIIDIVCAKVGSSSSYNKYDANIRWYYQGSALYTWSSYPSDGMCELYLIDDGDYIQVVLETAVAYLDLYGTKILCHIDNRAFIYDGTQGSTIPSGTIVAGANFSSYLGSQFKRTGYKKTIVVPAGTDYYEFINAQYANSFKQLVFGSEPGLGSEFIDAVVQVIFESTSDGDAYSRLGLGQAVVAHIVYDGAAFGYVAFHGSTNQYLVILPMSSNGSFSGDVEVLGSNQYAERKILAATHAYGFDSTDDDHVPTCKAVNDFVSTGNFPNMTVGSAGKLAAIKKDLSANTYTAIAECYNSYPSLDYSYSGLILSFTCRTNTLEDIKGLIVVSPYEWDTSEIISRTIIQGARYYSNTGTIPEFILVGNSNKRTVQLWALAQYTCSVAVSAINLSGASFSSIESTSSTAPANSFVSSLYCEVVAKTTDNNKSYSKTGTEQQPVYVDSDGQVKPCTGIGEEFYIPDVTSAARYFTLGWTTIDTSGGLSRLTLEIGPLVPYNTGDASVRNGKIIATLRSFNGSDVASILLINMEGLVPDYIGFYTYKADGKLYLVLRLSAYMSGASAKCISHGRPERPYAVGVLYSSTVAPATLTDSNVTYRALSVDV